MAEAGAGFDIRRLLLVGVVVVVIAVSVLFFLYRGCAPVVGKRVGYLVVYSNLDLKDAANVIARLKELTIPYEIRDEGKAIAVPKDRADQARLGLAEKNLPTGGIVGWEIFNESRLGATDFDRRIQLIRAISGELSRTIRRIDGVEDVRVQVVIPETKLFAAASAPVTASILLHLRPGFELSSAKIIGIVHLVASSVENLQPENITVIDDSGRILSAKAEKPGIIPVPPPPAEIIPQVIAASAEVVVTREAKPIQVTASLEAIAAPVVTQAATLSVEEKILLRIQAKKDLEQELSAKAQEMLNRFYPPNASIVKISSELRPTKEIKTRAKDLIIKKLKAIVLIDNRIDLQPKLKKATFVTVAAAMNYNKKRGDRIILQKVPFHLATPLPTMEVKVRPLKKSSLVLQIGEYLKWGSWFAVAVILIWLFNIVRGRWRTGVEGPVRGTPTAAPPVRERTSMLDQIKSVASRNPEQIAELLKRWLSE